MFLISQHRHVRNKNNPMMSFTTHCASSLHKAALNRVIICDFHWIRIVNKSRSVLMITWRGFPKVAGYYVTSAAHTSWCSPCVSSTGYCCYKEAKARKWVLPVTWNCRNKCCRRLYLSGRSLPFCQERSPCAAMRSEASLLSRRTPTFGLSVAASQSSNRSVRHTVLQGHPGSFQLTCQYFCTGSTIYYGIIIFGVWATAQILQMAICRSLQHVDELGTTRYIAWWIVMNLQRTNCAAQRIVLS